MQADFKEALDKLLQAICDDYNGWSSNATKEPHDGYWTPERIEVTVGKKYVKLCTPNNSVWSFVVIADNDKDFSRGTILKAASWNSPARNHARGNIFTGFVVNWTGASYMGTSDQAENERLAAKAEFDQNEIEFMMGL